MTENTSPTPASAGSAPAAAETLKLLNIIRPIAILDALLLIPLVWASLSDNEGLVSILGPIHGFGFLAMLALTVVGVLNDHWRWWFPTIVVVTLGPLGSLIGDVRVRRELAAQPS